MLKHHLSQHVKSLIEMKGERLPQSTAAKLVNGDAELCISSQVGPEAHPLDHLANLPIYIYIYPNKEEGVLSMLNCF